MYGQMSCLVDGCVGVDDDGGVGDDGVVGDMVREGGGSGDDDGGVGVGDDVNGYG